MPMNFIRPLCHINNESFLINPVRPGCLCALERFQKTWDSPCPPILPGSFLYGIVLVCEIQVCLGWTCLSEGLRKFTTQGGISGTLVGFSNRKSGPRPTKVPKNVSWDSHSRIPFDIIMDTKFGGAVYTQNIWCRQG